MKLKINQIQPNPFKKQINNGKLDEENVKKLMANIEELGLMGALPIVEQDKQYYLVYGHHRLEALKRTFGERYYINVDLKTYNEDQLLRGMVIENLTQRSNDFREELDNLQAIKKYLQNNNCPLSGQKSNTGEAGRPKGYDAGSCRDIAGWLDKNTGNVMKRSKISDILRIAENLDEELLENVKKQSHAAGEKDGDEEIIGVKIATILSSFKDKQEQKDLAKAIKQSREQHGNKVAINITAYKEASEEIKEEVRNGKIDLADVKDETDKNILREEEGKRPRTIFIPNFNQRMNDFNNNVETLERQVKIFSKIFHSEDFKQRYYTLKPKQQTNLNVNIFNIKKRVKECYDEITYFMEQISDRTILLEGEIVK